MSSKSKKMTSRRKCWVPTCRNGADQGFDKKFLFLPAKSQTRELWIALSGKPTESIPPEEIVFCEEHFSGQDTVKIGTNSYINKMVLVPNRNMPDRTCRTCMSIIPPDQSFHIMSSKFTSEMPSSIKDILFFWISSKPEPLHHIFTFCMPELKIPRDPCQLICSDCFHNIWLFFVYKITCIEVEKDLKGDMSWENYGKKVLCRSCIQTSGTNFIPLSAQSNMGILLQKMFVNDCPSPEIVPLQVCLICFNVLEKLDHFSKNCHEVEEKMKRHIALKNKYNQSSIKQLPSSSVYKSNFPTNINETMKEASVTDKIGAEFFCIQNMSGSQTTNPNIVKNCLVGTSNRDKLTLARLMSKHGHPLRNDLYQQEVWSLICQKMQKEGIGCTVPGLINVWKGMIKETKRKFDMGEPTGYLDELVMQFYKKKPESTDTSNLPTLANSLISKSASTVSTDAISLSSTFTEASTSSQHHNDLILKEKSNEKKKVEFVRKTCDENKQKKAIPADERSSYIVTSKSDHSSARDQSRQSWSDEMKLNFIKIFRREYNEHASKRTSLKISIKKGPWRTICMRLTDHSDYKEYKGLFLYRVWTSMRYKAEREKNQADISPASKIVLGLLNKESLVHQALQSEKNTKLDERSPPTLPKKIDRKISNKGKMTVKNILELEKKEKLRTGILLSNQTEQNEMHNGGSKRGRRKTIVPHEEKIAFLKAVVSEYDACTDHEKSGKGPWCKIIRRVVKKLPTWSYAKAYAFWSKLRVSALTHEKGSSDVFDNEVWKLLQRQEEFKKVTVGVSAAIKEKSQTTSLPNGIHDTKKRLSNETLPSSDKRQKSLLTLSEEEKLGLVELLKKTYDQMYKEEPSSVYWSAVIKRIFEKGGYKNFTLEEVDTIWNRMIFNASKRKHDEAPTVLDKEIHKLVSRASEIQTDSESLLLIREVKSVKKNKHTSRLIEDNSPSRSENCSKLISTDSDTEDVSSHSGGSWGKDEKMACISAVMKYGEEALKHGFGEKLWGQIYKEYTNKGYNRPAAAFRSYWYSMRQHAKMTLVNKKAGNEFDKIINSFFGNNSSPIENTGNEDLESRMIEDNIQTHEERREDEPVQYVDLTYNYVSFEDIEKLSEETLLDKHSMKIESSIKAEGNEKNDHETIGNFIMAKVEGGVQFVNEESNQNNEATCAESSNFEKSAITDEKDTSDDFISENVVLEGNESEINIEKIRTIMSEGNTTSMKRENMWTELQKSSAPKTSERYEIIELIDSDEEQ